MARPWFKFWVDSFVGGTANWTTLQRGAYLMLLCHQYTAGTLPTKRRLLEQISGLTAEEFDDFWVFAESKFERSEDGLSLVNPRMAKEIEEQNRGYQTAVAKARKSHSKRRKNSSAIAEQVAGQLPSTCKEQSSSSSSSKSTSSSKSFVKPTIEEVKAYCAKRGNNVDASQFIDYYTSNGWKVGRNAMKDWKATIRTWEKNGFKNSNTEPSKPKFDARKLLEGLEQ